MYPEIISIGPFTVHSYGLMLGIAFIVASWMLTKEFERRGIDTQLATEITLLAIVFGVIGSKLFHLFANMDEFFNDPIGALFSPGGLTFHGGLLLAMLAIYIRMRQKKVPFLFIADCAAPALAIAYGIGRIGCHLAGDGDYGIPTSLPWGTNSERNCARQHPAAPDPNLRIFTDDCADGDFTALSQERLAYWQTFLSLFTRCRLGAFFDRIYPAEPAAFVRIKRSPVGCSWFVGRRSVGLVLLHL